MLSNFTVALSAGPWQKAELDCVNLHLDWRCKSSITKYNKYTKYTKFTKYQVAPVHQ